MTTVPMAGFAKHFIAAGLMLMAGLCATGQPYKDAALPVSARVADLLQRMTPLEKFWQLFMVPADLDDTTYRPEAGIFGIQPFARSAAAGPAQQLISGTSSGSSYHAALKINEWQRFYRERTRLGIPVIPFDEALHGLVREGATAFPQAIGLAATWNTSLMHEVAEAIARECKSRGIRQVLSPVVNLASDVRWGRTEETYGEDPFLASEMGVAYISAFEKAGVIATPKHFVANVGHGGRDSYPIHYSDRYMREFYYPPFEACIRRAGARSLMTAYNSFDGTPCTASPALLNQLLKNEWKFGGFVISDAGATGGANVLHMTAGDYAEATAKSLAAGLDVIFQSDIKHHSLFSSPFHDGSVEPRVIDSAVARVLRAKFELGLFENPYADPLEADSVNGHPDHRRLAKEAARESVVLLKNARQALPLSRAVRSIAVTGPDAAEARLGGYSGPGNHKVSILEGIRQTAGKNVKVNYAPGCRRESVEFAPVPAENLSCVVEGTTHQGLLGEYFNNISLSGQPVFRRIDQQIKFQWTLFSPDPEKLAYDFYSARWTGKLKAPVNGVVTLGIDGNDGYRLYIDDKLILESPVKQTRRVLFTDFRFQKDRLYDIRIEYYEPTGNAWFSLVWKVASANTDDEMEKAVRMAKKSDVAIVVVGIEEGEFRDRALLSLPGRQEELIERISATGKPVIVILTGGSAITMQRWMDKVHAIIMAWYPGEAGGYAVAEILFGLYTPAGRLPFSWPWHEGQLPLVYNHKPTGRGDDYLNITGQALYPFGFGLSYTSFDYSEPVLEKERLTAGNSAWVSVRVTNTGSRAGDEVVQLYLRDEVASVARPVSELKAFSRIRLEPDETKEVRFLITPEMLTLLDKDLNKVVETGVFRIMIGASSKDIRQRAFLTVTQ